MKRTAKIKRGSSHEKPIAISNNLIIKNLKQFQNDFISNFSWTFVLKFIFSLKKKFLVYYLSVFLSNFYNKQISDLIMHWSKQLKDQPVLLLSSFVHNSPINEHKNMKLRENTYKRIN